MKKIIFLLLFMFIQLTSWACEVCEKQQPKVLRGITHGAGPQSDWDYVVVGCMMIIVAVSLCYSVKCIIRPGENERAHIKHSIFNSDRS